MKFSKPLRIIRNLLFFFFISTAVTVVVYSFMPVYVTPLMVIRSVQQIFKGESPAWHHEWIPFNEISPHLPMAVIASEDNRLRLYRNTESHERERKTQTETRCKHHQPADSEECISVAAILMAPQGL